MQTLKSSSLTKRAALVLLIGASLVSGCSSFDFKQADPVTIRQVIQRNKDGVPSDTIIKSMREADGVYRLTAAQLAELHELGLPDPVLNYMQQTYIDAERRQQSAEDWHGGMGDPMLIGKRYNGDANS